MTDISDNTTGTTGSATDGTTNGTGAGTTDLAAQAAELFVLLRIADRDQHRGHGPREGRGGHSEHGEHGGRDGRGGRGGRGGREGFRGAIRSGQGRVLGILALQSPLPQKNLAFMLGVRPQSLSELVAKLEAGGLVTRERDVNDRRSFLIDLTEAGREAATEIDASTGADPFDVLTDEEQETWSGLTAKVTEALAEKFPEVGERARHLREAGRDFGPGFGSRSGPGPHGGPHGHDGPHGGPRGHRGPRPEDPEFHDTDDDCGPSRGRGRGRGRRPERFDRFGGSEEFRWFGGFGRGMNPGFA